MLLYTSTSRMFLKFELLLENLEISTPIQQTLPPGVFPRNPVKSKLTVEWYMMKYFSITSNSYKVEYTSGKYK